MKIFCQKKRGKIVHKNLRLSHEKIDDKDIIKATVSGFLQKIKTGFIDKDNIPDMRLSISYFQWLAALTATNAYLRHMKTNKVIS